MLRLIEEKRNKLSDLNFRAIKSNILIVKHKNNNFRAKKNHQTSNAETIWIFRKKSKCLNFRAKIAFRQMKKSQY